MVRNGRIDARRVSVLAAALMVILAGCQWSMARSDATGAGYNPVAPGLDADNVGDMDLELTATATGASTTVPVVAGRSAYVTTARGGLRAFDLAGAGCSGTPLVCLPRWSAAPGTNPGQAIVAGGTVFVGIGSDLHAYDAAGTAGCSGTPVVCQPLWTAPGWRGSSVAADGRLFVTHDEQIATFDVAGVAGCGGLPKVCTPLWISVVEYEYGFIGLSPPAVADGVLYVGTVQDDSLLNGGRLGSLVAFDATGSVGCAGSPRICHAKWEHHAGAVTSSPAVVDGVVYVSWYRSFEGVPDTRKVEGLPTESCWAGTGCSPTWSVTHNGIGAPPIAVANGLLHVSGGNDTLTYATSGGSPCAGVSPCPPLRRSAATGIPSVTDDLLYIGGRAFDVTGDTGCAGAPPTCQPLWTAPGPAGITIPTNGRVLVWASDGATSTLSAFDVS